MSPGHLRRKLDWHKRSKENLANAIDHDVAIAMGTDSGAGPHGQNLRELAFMCELGMSPLDAIVAATRTAAQLLKLDEHVGTLEIGKRSDVVVFAGDALADVSGMGDPDRISLVVKDGVIHKRTTGEPRADEAWRRVSHE